MYVDKLVDQLKKQEGFRSKPYKDTVGKLTIGYGRNLDDVGISESEASYLLREDINKSLTDALTFYWFTSLDDVRQGVIVNMIFNMGLAKFKEFKKMISHIEHGEWKSASLEMLDSKWAKQVGNRAVELARLLENGY